MALGSRECTEEGTIYVTNQHSPRSPQLVAKGKMAKWNFGNYSSCSKHSPPGRELFYNFLEVASELGRYT